MDNTPDGFVSAESKNLRSTTKQTPDGPTANFKAKRQFSKTHFSRSDLMNLTGDGFARTVNKIMSNEFLMAP